MSMEHLSRMATALDSSVGSRLNQADIDLNRALKNIYRDFGTDLAAFFEAARQGQQKTPPHGKTVKRGRSRPALRKVS